MQDSGSILLIWLIIAILLLPIPSRTEGNIVRSPQCYRGDTIMQNEQETECEVDRTTEMIVLILVILGMVMLVLYISDRDTCKVKSGGIGN